MIETLLNLFVRTVVSKEDEKVQTKRDTMHEQLLLCTVKVRILKRVKSCVCISHTRQPCLKRTVVGTPVDKTYRKE